MPSHRAQIMARYPEGYRPLPRNSKTRPESLCSVTPSTQDKTVGPGAEEKRRSMRDDTMWQLYEWQQRQFYNKQSTLPRRGTLTSPKTMVNISDQTMPSIPTSPSHGSMAAYQGYSPQRTYRSEVSSPIQRGDGVTLFLIPNLLKHVAVEFLQQKLSVTRPHAPDTQYSTPPPRSPPVGTVTFHLRASS